MLDRTRTMQTHPPHVVELLPCPSAAGGRRLRQTKRTRAYALDEHLDVWLDAIVVDGCVRHGCPVRGRAQSVVCRIRPGNSDEQMLPLVTVALRAPSIIVESGNVLLGSVLEV